MSCKKVITNLQALAKVFLKIHFYSSFQGIIKIEPTECGKRAISLDIRGNIGAVFGDTNNPQERQISPKKN